MAVTYSEALGDAVCAAVANGARITHLREDADPFFPARQTVLDWLQRYPAFARKLDRARELRVEVMFDDLLTIADDVAGDRMPDPDPAKARMGYTIACPEKAVRARLQIDTRKWAMARLRPGRYGDRTQTTLTGPNDGPIQVQETLRTLSDAELATIEGILVQASQPARLGDGSAGADETAD